MYQGAARGTQGYQLPGVIQRRERFHSHDPSKRKKVSPASGGTQYDQLSGSGHTFRKIRSVIPCDEHDPLKFEGIPAQAEYLEILAFRQAS